MVESERVVDADLHVAEMKDHIDCMKRLRAAETENAWLRDRIAELEEISVEALAQLIYYKDALPINRSMFCDTPDEFQEELREKARAALQGDGEKDAPGEGRAW